MNSNTSGISRTWTGRVSGRFRIELRTRRACSASITKTTSAQMRSLARSARGERSLSPRALVSMSGTRPKTRAAVGLRLRLRPQTKRSRACTERIWRSARPCPPDRGRPILLLEVRHPFVLDRPLATQGRMQIPSSAIFRVARVCVGRVLGTSNHASPVCDRAPARLPGTSDIEISPCRRHPVASSHVRGGATSRVPLDCDRHSLHPSKKRPDEASSGRSLGPSLSPLARACFRAFSSTYRSAFRTCRGELSAIAWKRPSSTGPFRPKTRLTASASRAPTLFIPRANASPLSVCRFCRFRRPRR